MCMLHKYKTKIAAGLLALAFILTSALQVFAAVTIDYTGFGGSGGSSGGSASNTSFAVAGNSNTNQDIVGWRFSIYNSDGSKRKIGISIESNTIDIMVASNLTHHLVNQNNGKLMSKKEWINTISNTTIGAGGIWDSVTFKQENCGFGTALTNNRDSMAGWIKTTRNYQAIYTKTGLGATAARSSDVILIEPLFRVNLVVNGTRCYCALSVADMAVFGYAKYGGSSTGMNKEWSAGTYGYIADYTNRIYPAWVYTSAKNNFWSVGGSNLSSRISYERILTQGYGVSYADVSEMVPPYVTPSVSITPVTLYGETTTSSGTRVQDQLQAQLNSGTAYSGELLSYYVYYTNNGDEDSTFILNDAAKENNRDGGAVNRQHYSDKEMWIGKKSSHVCSPWESDSTYRNTQWRSKNTTQDGTIDYTASIKYKADGNYNASASKQVKVVKTDLAVQEIQVYRNGSRLTNEQYQTLRCGDSIEVRYVYKNNTDAKVYARMDWYKNDNREEDSKTAIISANSEYTVSVPMTVGDLRYNHDSVQNGRLYLFARITIADLSFDQDSWYGTNYESNGSNNVLDLSIVFQTPLAGEFIQPNSTYRRGTEIVASFSVWNTTAFGLLPPETATNDSKNMCVGFVPILKITGANGYEATISPSMNRVLPPANLATDTVYPTTMWYKWQVPEDFHGDTATLTLYIDYGNNFAKESLQRDIPVAGGGTRSNKPIVTATVSITDKLVVQTPDTAYSPNRPSWYNSLSTKNVVNGNTDVRSSSLYTDDVKTVAGWSYWTYQNNRFRRVTESANLQTAAWLSVANKYVNGNQYKMRSGYGLTLKTRGDILATDKVKQSCTVSQSGFVFFPEFMYTASTDSIRDRYNKLAPYYLKQSSNAFEDTTGFKRIPMTADGKFKADTVNNGVFGTFASLAPIQFSTEMQLPLNTTNEQVVHYTPLWMPDGDYKVLVYLSDAWTPGGMLSGYTFSNAITIEGDMLDDYTIGVYGDY